MTTLSDRSDALPPDSGAPGLVVRIALDKPSLEDNRADADRLRQALQRRLAVDRLQMDLAQMRQLPEMLREADYRVCCIVIKERYQCRLIHVAPDGGHQIFAGLAVDLGTTRVAMRLVDLDGGRIVSETTFDNPQCAVGPDILTRIHFVDRPDGSVEGSAEAPPKSLPDESTTLQRLIVDAINENASCLCREAGMRPSDIYLVTVAGNTTMSHLLARLPVHWMIREPYIPAANHFDLYAAQMLGIDAHPHALVFIFPNVGSYFGGDLIAGILFSGMHLRSDISILVDVGTNAEVVLGNQDWLMACAGAAGPALESGVAGMGTTAGPGVIDRVNIDPRCRRFDLHTIDGLPPKGICGSGVIDLAAQLFLAGMIDIRGKFKSEACGERLVHDDDLARLVVVPPEASADGNPLTLSQAELDSLIRSKAAMYTILETLTATMGLSLDQLETFFVAGTFGAFINPVSAITLGMIPDLPLDRYRSLGNSSLGGATLALTDIQAVSEAQAVQERITYMELNVNQDFMNRFSAAKFIPHTDAGRFPSLFI